jgi:hypothetical protein
LNVWKNGDFAFCVHESESGYGFHYFGYQYHLDPDDIFDQNRIEVSMVMEKYVCLMVAVWCCIDVEDDG